MIGKESPADHTQLGASFEHRCLIHFLPLGLADGSGANEHAARRQLKRGNCSNEPAAVRSRSQGFRCRSVISGLVVDIHTVGVVDGNTVPHDPSRRGPRLPRDVVLFTWS